MDLQLLSENICSLKSRINDLETMVAILVKNLEDNVVIKGDLTVNGNIIIGTTATTIPSQAPPNGNLTISGLFLTPTGNTLINPKDRTSSLTEMEIPTSQESISTDHVSLINNSKYISNINIATDTIAIGNSSPSIINQTEATSSYQSILIAENSFTDTRQIQGTYMEFKQVDPTKPFWAYQVVENPPLKFKFLPLFALVVEAGFAALGAYGTSRGWWFSDRTLKTNIHYLFTSKAGVPVYQFQYKYDKDNRIYRGTMAQDLLSIKPSAVALHPNGYYMVDYNQLDLERMI